MQANCGVLEGGAVRPLPGQPLLHALPPVEGTGKVGPPLLFACPGRPHGTYVVEPVVVLAFFRAEENPLFAVEGCSGLQQLCGQQ